MFVLVLTGWHLRERGRPWLLRSLHRASWLAMLPALVLLLTAFGLDAADRSFHTGYEAGDPTANDVRLIGGVLTYSQALGGFRVLGQSAGFLLWLTLWVAICALDVPAWLMVGKTSRRVWTLPEAAVVFAPWLAVLYLVGWPSQAMPGDYGMMDGGVVLFPLLGAYLFLYAASIAAVSAAGRRAVEAA